MPPAALAISTPAWTRWPNLMSGTRLGSIIGCSCVTRLVRGGCVAPGVPGPARARLSGSIHREDVGVDVGGPGRAVRRGQREIDRAEIEGGGVEDAGQRQIIVQRVDRGRAEPA